MAVSSHRFRSCHSMVVSTHQNFETGCSASVHFAVVVLQTIVICFDHCHSLRFLVVWSRQNSGMDYFAASLRQGHWLAAWLHRQSSEMDFWNLFVRQVTIQMVVLLFDRSRSYRYRRIHLQIFQRGSSAATDLEETIQTVTGSSSGRFRSWRFHPAAWTRLLQSCQRDYFLAAGIVPTGVNQTAAATTTMMKAVSSDCDHSSRPYYHRHQSFQMDCCSTSLAAVSVQEVIQNCCQRAVLLLYLHPVWTTPHQDLQS